jgi:large subunit ribosomal protein L22
MASSTAHLKNYRQSPRKVRLVADLVRGKNVEHALALLSTLPKRASEPMEKLLRSAVSNAGVTAGELYVDKIEVNGGIIFRRMMPRARGRGAMVKKKSSHITIALRDSKPAGSGAKPAKAAAKAPKEN